MHAVESNALNCLYPKEITKPQLKIGIDSCNRLDAQRELLRYYKEEPDVIGLPFFGDKFKDIAQFLEHITVNPNIGEIELKQLFSPSIPTDTDKQFLHQVSVINNFISEHSIFLSTCNYRSVSAISQNTASFDGQSFTFGGVGGSGAHELFRMKEKDEVKILQEGIIEILIVSGTNIETMTPHEKDSLAAMIQDEASTEIHKKQPTKMTNSEFKQRTEEVLAWIESGNWTVAKPMLIPKALNISSYGVLTRHFSNSENCDDYSNLAIRCAKKIIDTLGLQLTIDTQYRYCAMHKYINYENYYIKAGLPPPGQFGRLRCPSYCAETQADARNAFSLLIPFMTGEQSSYLIAIDQYGEHSKVYDEYRPEIWARYLSDFHYLTPSKNDSELMIEKHLIVENFLSLGKFLEDNIYRSFLYIAEALKNIDLNTFRSIRIQTDHNKQVSSNNSQSEQILVEGIPTYAEDKDTFQRIANLSLENIRQIPMSSVHIGINEKLWTSAPPCFHCINVLRFSNVDTIYIDTIPWEGLKGDDGLALEALSQLPIRTVVLR